MWAGVAEAFRIWHSGVTTNFWGLGCPFYCTSPALGSYIAFLLLGFIGGTAFGAWIAFTFLAGSYSQQAAEPAAVAPSALIRRRTRLQGYAYE